MKRPALLALAAIVIVAATCTGFYFARPSPLVWRVQTLERELGTARHEIDRLTADNEKLQAAHQSALDARAAVAASGRRLEPAAGSAPADDAVVVGRYRLTKMEELLLEKSYGPLYATFGLNDAELAHFKHLLGDRRATLSDISMRYMETGLTREQETARAHEVFADSAAARKKFDAAIRHFLNNDTDYEAYRDWEDSGAERLHVASALLVFEGHLDPLSEEQQKRLLKLMVSVRKARRPLPKGSTSDARNQQDAEKLQILDQAAAFLNPHQVEVLKRTSIAVPR